MLGRNLPKGIIRANYKCQYENPYKAFLTISKFHDNSYIVQSNYYKSFTWPFSNSRKLGYQTIHLSG